MSVLFSQTQFTQYPVLACFECMRFYDIPQVRDRGEVVASMECPECFKPVAFVGIVVHEREARLMDRYEVERRTGLLTHAAPTGAILRAIEAAS